MLHRIIVTLLLSVSWAGAYGQATIPHSPAGQTLRAWLEAFNSVDRARVEQFVRKFAPKLTPEATMDFRNRTGKLELLSVVKEEPTHLQFRVKQSETGKVAVGDLYVKDGTSPQLVSLNFTGLQDLSTNRTAQH